MGGCALCTRSRQQSVLVHGVAVVAVRRRLHGTAETAAVWIYYCQRRLLLRPFCQGRNPRGGSRYYAGRGRGVGIDRGSGLLRHQVADHRDARSLMAIFPTPELPPPAGETVHKTVIFDHVSIAFEDKLVLDDVSFELTRGETKMILGVLGSGKSTLLKMAIGLVRPDGGDIYLLGHHINAMKEDELFELRRKVGMVFQESALFDSLTVRENVGYRLIEEGIDAKEIDSRVSEALRFVELEH